MMRSLSFQYARVARSLGRCTSAAALIVGTAGFAGAQARSQSNASVSFYREIFPIFRTACSGCHNGESAAGGLNLTSYTAVVKGGRGGALYAPGKGADSRLVKYLTGALKPQMPPGGALKSTEIDRIRLWVDGGAKADAPLVESRPAAAVKPGAIKVRTASVSHGGVFVLNRPAPVTALAYGTDGKTIAIGTYREVQFRNLETNALIARWAGHPDTVRGLVYSRDGKLLAAAGGSSGATGEVRLWDVAAGKEVRVFGDHTDTINGIAFSPDATRLATASSDKTIKTWETATGKLIAVGKDHSDAVWGIAWSPDGKYLASCGADRSVKVWDATSMRRLYSMGGHEDVVFSVEFGADSKTVITASADRTAKIWNIGPEGGTAARTLAGHGSNVISASFAPSGGSATASGDKTVKLWDAAGGNTRTLTGAKDWVYVIRYSKDGKSVAAGTWDGAVLVWNTADGKLTTSFSTGPQY